MPVEFLKNRILKKKNRFLKKKKLKFFFSFVLKGFLKKCQPIRSSRLLCVYSQRWECLLCVYSPRWECFLCVHSPKRECLLFVYLPRWECLLCVYSPRWECLLLVYLPRRNCLLWVNTPKRECMLCVYSPKRECLLYVYSTRWEFLLCVYLPRRECLLCVCLEWVDDDREGHVDYTDQEIDVQDKLIEEKGSVHNLFKIKDIVNLKRLSTNFQLIFSYNKVTLMKLKMIIPWRSI